ncbi:MAG: Uma2 family endonuclease [Thermoleophilaceae bacterium]|nr:Uma2 family endonuclease [Thermoleophilaceae bacterium]
MFALQTWARSGRERGRVLDRLDLRLDEHNVVSPGVMWYAKGRAPARVAEPPSPMPDIAVEVHSSSAWRYDIGAKKAAYERHRSAGAVVGRHGR